MSTNFLVSQESPLRILFVEDNELNIFYIGKVTRGLHDTIDMAENGRVALEKASTTLYDVIFMDLQLPVMNGYEAIKEIRSLPKPYCNVPIIGMTSNEVELDLSLEKNSGINDFIDKAFTIEELKSKISSWRRDSTKDSNQELSDLTINYPLLAVKNTKARNTMIQIFMKQKDEFLEKMDVSIAECNWENIYFLIHRMQSSVEIMGITLAKTTLALMEKNSKEKNLEDLKLNYNQVKQSLKNYSPPTASL